MSLEPTDPIAVLRQIADDARSTLDGIRAGSALTGVAALKRIDGHARDAVRHVAEDDSQRRGHSSAWIERSPCNGCGAAVGEPCRSDCAKFGTQHRTVA